MARLWQVLRLSLYFDNCNLIYFSRFSEDFIDQWFLMSSPVPLLMLIVTYLLFVLIIGPYYMKKQQPYNLNFLLVLYNFLQVAMSTYLFMAVSTFKLFKEAFTYISVTEKSLLPTEIVFFSCRIKHMLENIL